MEIDQKGKPPPLYVGKKKPVFPRVSGLVDDGKRSFEDLPGAGSAASGQSQDQSGRAARNETGCSKRFLHGSTQPGSPLFSGRVLTIDVDPLRDDVDHREEAVVTGFVGGLDPEIDVPERQAGKAERAPGRFGRARHLLDRRTELQPEKGEIGFAARIPADPFQGGPFAGPFDGRGNPGRKRGQTVGEKVGDYHLTRGAGVVSPDVLKKGHPAVRRIEVHESLVSVDEPDALIGREPGDMVVEIGNAPADVSHIAEPVLARRDG